MNTTGLGPASRPTSATAITRGRALLARMALVSGAVTAMAFTAITVFTTRTPDDHPFRHAADYWYTGVGMLPGMAAPLVIVLALHHLQRGRDGVLGRIGAAVTVAALTVFLAMRAYAMAFGEAKSFGPTYVITTFCSFAGSALVAVGSWRSGLLPGWLATFWVIAWIIGGPAGQLITPLVLAAAYLTIAAALPESIQSLRVDRETSSRTPA